MRLEKILRDKIIRLAYEKKELRGDLLPLLARTAGVTITISRGDEDITVAMDSKGKITESIDEKGKKVKLTKAEKASAKKKFEAGEDETGR